MNTSTRVTLVLLRLAIGCHFLFEGLEKVQTHYTFGPFAGAREGKPVWTSEPYLRGGAGPVADQMKIAIGDVDRDAFERLTLPEAKPGHMPPALEKDWQDKFDLFVKFYKVGEDKDEEKKPLPPEVVAALAVAPGSGLAGVPWLPLEHLTYGDEADPLPLKLARNDLRYAKAAAVLWLLRGERSVEQTVAKSPEKVMVTQTTEQRLKEYQGKVKKLRAIEAENWEFGQDVWKKKWPELNKETARARKELLDDANKPLDDTFAFVKKHRLTKAQRDLGTPPAAEPFRWLPWIDRATMWGLTAVGACLLLGLFTRTACVGGALFLLMFYLTMPPWPWLPDNPRAEGHYFFINKNLIEMLALLALATTASGKWVGLDGLVQFLRPERRTSPPAPDHKPATKYQHPGGPIGPRLERTLPRSAAATSPAKEPPHGP